MSVGTKPITSSTFLVLLALADRDRHGLGIADDIETRTDSKVRLGAGTLYNAIGKMLAAGLIQEVSTVPDPTDDDPRRRYYHITAAGRRAMRAELERLTAVLALARAKSGHDG